MSTPHHSLTTELQEHHQRCDRRLKELTGMGYRTFRKIKAFTQLIGITGGWYAMYLGADPGFALLLMTVMWAGPEAVEAVLDDASDADE